MQVSQCLGREACTDAGHSVPGEGGGGRLREQVTQCLGRRLRE